jgi:hypothetical protein
MLLPCFCFARSKRRVGISCSHLETNSRQKMVRDTGKSLPRHEIICIARIALENLQRTANCQPAEGQILSVFQPSEISFARNMQFFLS